MSLSKLVFKTFDEWSRLGFRIKKGEKATYGKFSSNQVWKPYDEYTNEYDSWYHGHPEDYPAEADMLGHEPGDA